MVLVASALLLRIFFCILIKLQWRFLAKIEDWTKYHRFETYSDLLWERKRFRTRKKLHTLASGKDEAPGINVDTLGGILKIRWPNFANYWPPTYHCLHWLTFGLPSTLYPFIRAIPFIRPKSKSCLWATP